MKSVTNDQKSLKRERDTLLEIWRGPCSCAVCRQRLSPSAVSCVGGHVFCTSCKQLLTECTICKKQFSSETQEAFKKVLELLPKYCRHVGCSKVVEDVNCLRDHEVWCGHRTSLCMMCCWSGHLSYRWSGQVKDLYKHCMKKHFVIHKTREALEVVLNMSYDQSSLCLLRSHDQMFWVKCSFEQASDIIAIQVTWQPNGVVTSNIFEAKVELEFGSSKTTMIKPIVYPPTFGPSQSNLFEMSSTSLKSFDVGETVKLNLWVVLQ